MVNPQVLDDENTYSLEFSKVKLICFYTVCVQDLVASAVLSGNRNFEGRVHPLTRANYLASPPLVVAYALAGTVR